VQEVGNLKRTENLVLIRNDLRRDMDSSNWKKRTGADFSRVVRLTPESHTRKSAGHWQENGVRGERSANGTPNRRHLLQPDFLPGIVSGCTVIRPASEPSAEITSYKPTISIDRSSTSVSAIWRQRDRCESSMNFQPAGKVACSQ